MFVVQVSQKRAGGCKPTTTTATLTKRVMRIKDMSESFSFLNRTSLLCLLFVLFCLISIFTLNTSLSNKRRKNVMTMFVAFIYESNDVFFF